MRMLTNTTVQKELAGSFQGVRQLVGPQREPRRLQKQMGRILRDLGGFQRDLVVEMASERAGRSSGGDREKTKQRKIDSQNTRTVAVIYGCLLTSYDVSWLLRSNVLTTFGQRDVDDLVVSVH